jgi:predicted dehydrogenase
MAVEGFQEIDYAKAELPRIGIGLLGCGFIGQVHSNAYTKIPYTCPSPAAEPKLIALCDEMGAAEKARKFGFQGAYTDWRRMVADPRISIFDNCTPDDTHCEPSIAAAENGKHVVCEKPLAMTVADARRMMQAVQKAGVKSMCCHNYRFLPAVRLARQLIENGVLGKIYHFRGQYLQPYGHDPEAVIENAWYAAGTASGVLLGIGSHVIDMARFLVGEITTLSGLAKTFNTSRKRGSTGEMEEVTADEGNLATVEFDNGAIGVLESSCVCAGRHNEFTFEVNGSKGSLAFDLEDPNHLQVCDCDVKRAELLGFANVSVTTAAHPLQIGYLPPGHNSGWENGHLHALNHFIDCVINDKPVAPYAADFEDAYKVQVIMDAIFESSKTGQRVQLKY